MTSLTIGPPSGSLAALKWHRRPGATVRLPDGRTGTYWADAPRRGSVWIALDGASIEEHRAAALELVAVHPFEALTREERGLLRAGLLEVVA